MTPFFNVGILKSVSRFEFDLSELYPFQNHFQQLQVIKIV